jgi:hypothetical protein
MMMSANKYYSGFIALAFLSAYPTVGQEDSQSAEGARSEAGQESIERAQVKQEEIRGVEISVVNSTVQDGVKPATRINLEKTLKLLSQPKPKPKPSPAAAAGLGGRKSKPKPGGGSGDARRVVSSPQTPEGGS